jgi:hypothetical protein
MKHADLPVTPFPGPFLRAIPFDQVHSPKVFLGTQATEDSPYLRAALDEAGGVVGGKGLMWIVPRHENPVGLDIEHMAFAILAIASSRLMAGWLDEVRTSRNNRATDVRRFPVPLARAAWDSLYSAGVSLASCGGNVERLSKALPAIDAIVEEAYGIRKRRALIQLLSDRFDGVWDVNLRGLRYPESPSSPAHAEVNDLLERDGAVLNVKDDRVHLWVPGVADSAIWMALPSHMPGYLCRPGATFRVLLDETDDLSRGIYFPHRAAWAGGEELQEIASNPHALG